jgi:hypothetical protein
MGGLRLWGRALKGQQPSSDQAPQRPPLEAYLKPGPWT